MEKINFEFFDKNKKHLVKEVFLIRGPEVGEIIPFPVWMIPLPVLKIDYELLGENERHFVK